MKNKNQLTLNDLKNIAALGIDSAALQKQLAVYRKGASYLKLDRPCTAGDGIMSLKPSERKKMTSFFDAEAGKYKLLKFVPASGAASRMFADWYKARETGGFGLTGLDKKFLRDLVKLPFYDLIKKDSRGKSLLAEKKIKGLLEFILEKDGLNFGALPKALIPFHRYSQGETRAAAEEHLDEAAQYLCGNNSVCHLHFTVSSEHKKDVAKYVKAAADEYGKL